MANSRQHKITVSTDCRFAGGPCGPGADLLALLNRSVSTLGKPLNDDFAITGTVCMATCTRPCTIAFHATGNATYLFGDIPPDEDIDDLVRLAAVYADGDGGEPFSRFPAALIVSEAMAGQFQ